MDIHTKSASEAFGVPMDQVTPDQRRFAKNVNFALLYTDPTSFPRTTWHVLDEHTFGYVSPLEPDTFCVMAVKPQKGSPHDPLGDPIVLEGLNLRSATLKDFEDYRINPEPYRLDKLFLHDIPTE